MEPQPDPNVVIERQTDVDARPKAGLAPPRQELSPTGTHIFDANGFSIYENEITAFIGPSGCGKTTVLRSLNRMNDLIAGARVEGDVRYRDAPLYGSGVSPIAGRRRIGMVFQKPNPFPKSIYDNIAYGPRINGIRNKKRLDEIVEKSLRQGALWD